MTTTWDRTKKDDAPRGVFRPSSTAWGICFTCGAGHVHEETIGPVKGEAIRAHAARRTRALVEPGWCPRVERARERVQAREAEIRASRRVTFREYATDYVAWAAVNKRSGRKERYGVEKLVAGELGPGASTRSRRPTSSACGIGSSRGAPAPP